MTTREILSKIQHEEKEINNLRNMIVDADLRIKAEWASVKDHVAGNSYEKAERVGNAIRHLRKEIESARKTIAKKQEHLNDLNRLLRR